MSIILCGLPMSGKTTVGGAIASQLNLEFIDTDRLIEKEYLSLYGISATCREIYREKGEIFFRELEKKCILSLKRNPSVIALGGGSLLDSANQAKIKNLGCLFFLRISIESLVKRIEKRGMPAYLDPEAPQIKLKEIALKRIPLYESIADVIVDVESLSPEQTVEKILLYRKSHGI